MARGDAAPPPDPAGKASERRQNQTLRELLDELITLVRSVSRAAPKMKSDELSYAQQRMEWLVDEIWRNATDDRK